MKIYKLIKFEVKFHIIAIFDQTSKGTNIKNILPNSIRTSSLIFKCENFLEGENLSKIQQKMIGDKIDNSDKFLKNFIENTIIAKRIIKESYLI